MTFYLKPPEGEISLSLFNTYAECRLRHLAGLRQYETGCHLPRSLVKYTDCLVEGNVKDRVSHFALRSVAQLDPPLYSFVLQKECILFTKRLLKMTEEDLTCSIVLLIKQLMEYEEQDVEYSQFFRDTTKVLRKMVKNGGLKHVKCSKIEPCSQTEINVLKVPFQHVLPMVAGREAVLSKGMVLLQCYQIPLYLTHLFTDLMKYGTKRMTEASCLNETEDGRFKELLVSLRIIYNRTIPKISPTTTGSLSSIRYQRLDEVSEYFPPCMKAIYQTLRTRHRLCHTPRVQFTLFLKEIGLPVDDLLSLIEFEYSKSAKQGGKHNGHVCEHSWQGHNRKYRYGTRHLYGLEGGRKNYSSHSCQRIQKDAPGPTDCGGCPFAHYDEPNLREFLQQDLGSEENVNAFCKPIKSDTILPIESCHLHLRFKVKQLVEVNSQLIDPSQDVRILENSQVKCHTVLKPVHYFSVLAKLHESIVRVRNNNND